MQRLSHWSQIPGIGLGLFGGASMHIWPDHLWIAYLFFGAGVILIIWPIAWQLKGNLPRFRYMPMKEAGSKLYAIMRKSNASFSATFYEGSGEDPEEILNHYAVAISQEVGIFGKFPPSNELEVVDKVLLQNGSFAGGGNEFVYYGEARPTIIDICIKRRSFKPAVRSIKETEGIET